MSPHQVQTQTVMELMATIIQDTGTIIILILMGQITTEHLTIHMITLIQETLMNLSDMTDIPRQEPITIMVHPMIIGLMIFIDMTHTVTTTDRITDILILVQATINGLITSFFFYRKRWGIFVHNFIYVSGYLCS